MIEKILTLCFSKRVLQYSEQAGSRYQDSLELGCVESVELVKLHSDDSVNRRVGE